MHLYTLKLSDKKREIMFRLLQNKLHGVTKFEINISPTSNKIETSWVAKEMKCANGYDFTLLTLVLSAYKWRTENTT